MYFSHELCAPWQGTRPARIKSHTNVQRLIKEEKNDEAVGPITSPGEVMTGRSGAEEHA